MRDILFVGEVMASVTHDMQNIMAIIKESGALVDDIFSINGKPALKFKDKLENSLENIQEQVGRGRDLMLMLNGFAHAAGNYPENSDLVRFAKQICILADRMVRLKECRLLANVSGKPLVVQGNALQIMQNVYRGIEAVLGVCLPGDSIEVEAFPQNESGVLHITRKSARRPEENQDPCPEPHIDMLAHLLAETGGTCRAQPGELELYFPLAPA